MYVFSVKWFVFGCLLVVHADENHQRQLPEFTPPAPKDHGPTTPAAIGLFIVPFPQSVADGSIVDVNPNFIAALQSGVSPFAAFVQSDTEAQRFPPDTNWTLPQHVALISSFINQTQANILKPGGQQQSNVGTSAQSSAPKDPVVLFAPVVHKPSKPNLVGQLLANAPGFNNSFAMITNLAEGKPSAAPSSISDSPQADPLQGLMDTPQSAVLNATSAVQGVIGQFGSNVQNGVGNFFGLSSNQQTNDQGSPNAPLNPVQSLVEGSQASWNNATAVAQGIAGQFGSNVQNGVSNVFGINPNWPNNDEPVTDTSQSTSPGPDTTTSTAQSSSTESAATNSSTVSTSVTAASTSATPTPGFSNPFPSLFNTSQLSLLNNSVLVQTLASQVSSNLANGLAGPFFANLNRHGVSSDQQAANGTNFQKPLQRPSNRPLAWRPTRPHIKSDP